MYKRQLGACRSSQEVYLERGGREGGVARLTLNKPERLNALSLSMIRGMSDAVEEQFGSGLRGSSSTDETERREREEGGSADEGGARLLVLRGMGGKAFCAGGDVKAIAEE